MFKIKYILWLDKITYRDYYKDKYERILRQTLAAMIIRRSGNEN